MAPSRVSKPRHTAAKALAKHQVTDDDDASQQGYQSSGDDNKVVKMAEKMRIDVIPPPPKINPGSNQDTSPC